MTDRQPTVLGVDIGSVSVALVQIDRLGRLSSRAYAFHRGRIRSCLQGLLAAQAIDPARADAVGCTANKGGPLVLAGALELDSHVAHIAAAQHLHGRVGAILHVGAERFSLTRFDAQGEYRDTHSNSSCAAGTGSFLDQQAQALGLADSAALSAAALRAIELEVPKIASRCAVFAKTDLIHAQQQGYSRDAICNGLCFGLASIVADTLSSGEPLSGPVIFAGGVALNEAVRRHLAELLGCPLTVTPQAPLYGALGAALLALEQLQLAPAAPPPAVALRDGEPARSYHYPPLELQRAGYPDFEGHQRYLFAPAVTAGGPAVEVDAYREPAAGRRLPIYVGFDIGSTSTKAVVVAARDRQVLAGFYTRTSGQPLTAAQAILEAITDWGPVRRGLRPEIRGAGTTGSGRRLVGGILGADLMVDEITAHARAAYELDPAVDTIIEIGGQDSKFTTLRRGMVTSAVMNTVCAAGTGSFIEEQALRLGCPLEAYAGAVAGAASPLASDRCTVFMQRDINHLLSRGYSVSEILAAVLHSVRENYLRKVARPGAIGERICFQGATAKNRALVAAFEQKLGRPIAVSRYCHLTGALGVALTLADDGVAETRFRGLSLYREAVELSYERCELCHNHCQIAVADVGREKVAYGFLCGRDYDTQRYVAADRSGFDLLRQRGAILRPQRRGGVYPRPRVPAAPAAQAGREPAPTSDPAVVRECAGVVTVGIPAALHLLEDLPLWQHFFGRLGVRVVTSKGCRDAVKVGKKLARAEFCASIAAFHGHVAYLAELPVDFIFAPVSLEAELTTSAPGRQYCYYTQYAASLVHNAGGGELRRKLVTPLVVRALGAFEIKARLYLALRQILGPEQGFARIAAAYDAAVEHVAAGRAELRSLMRRQLAELPASDIAVVLLGRPYTCLDPRMNKGIVELVAAQGVKAFFQDMLSYGEAEVASIAELLGEVHWHYATQVLEAAVVVARTPGLYPVLVSSFKCAPDSCTIEHFKRILDGADKPYLILELDEHGSSIGYETRIEAAVRAFRNHRREALGETWRPAPAAARRALPVNPAILRSIGDKTLFMPCWDRPISELLAANLRRAGVRARPLYEDADTIRRGMAHNTGQCIPLSAVAQSFIESVEAADLDPASAALWMFRSKVACNAAMFPAYLKSQLEAYGRGFERASVYVGELSMVEISVSVAINSYFAYLLGGYLRRLLCHVRPYEVRPGEADRAFEQGLARLREAFATGQSKLDALEAVVDRFAGIETRRTRRPKVAIFGDLYSRDNEVMNQDLVRCIERHGGEAITTPYNEYLKIVAGSYFSRWLREGKYWEVVVNRSLLASATLVERRYLEVLERVLGPAPEPPAEVAADVLARYRITERHAGESLDNILKVAHLVATTPDLSLFVQANPAFCCPSLVTEGMASRIEQLTGVPVVTITYDGTSASKNDIIIPFLKHPRRAGRSSVKRDRCA